MPLSLVIVTDGDGFKAVAECGGRRVEVPWDADRSEEDIREAIRRLLEDARRCD